MATSRTAAGKRNQPNSPAQSNPPAPPAPANPPLPKDDDLERDLIPEIPAGALRSIGQDSREIITLLVGELTEQDVDAIVSPANAESLLNSRVATQIAVRAGPALSKACNVIGRIPLGEAAITPGGKLKAKHVIHAACMNYDETTNEETLVMATRNALLRARENQLKSIAIPPLDTTSSTFPLKRCAELMISEVIRHSEKEATLEDVRFILDDERMRVIFEECLRQV